MARASSDVVAVAAEIEERRFDPWTLLSRLGAAIFLIALCITFAILEPAFFQTRNLFNVMRQISITGMMAIGMTFVILTAGIDLSVGSLLALAGIVCAAIVKGGRGYLAAGAGKGGEGPLGLAVAAAIGVGLAGGLLQGLSITKMRIPPFVVTLGGMSIFRGLALIFSAGQPISAFKEDFRWWGTGMIGPVPVPVIIFLLFVLIAYIILRYTQYGRYIYAVGGNPEAARLSGLNIDLLITSVYGIVGFFCGLGGFVLAARLNSAEQRAGVGYELEVIAAVVIGGTSLFGGEGSVLSTLVGAMLIGVIKNGLTVMNVNPYVQMVIIGFIIILAVWIDQLAKQRRR